MTAKNMEITLLKESPNFVLIICYRRVESVNYVKNFTLFLAEKPNNSEAIEIAGHIEAKLWRS